MTTVHRTVGLARVVRVVADLDSAERDYVDTLGCTPEGRDTIDPVFTRLHGVPGVQGLRSSLRLGDQRIDLVEFAGAPGRPYPDGSTSSDLWFQHLAIVVDDMDRAYHRVIGNGRFRPISRNGPVRLPESSGGVTAYKFRDPDGHPLELLAFGAQVPSRWAGGTAEGPFLGIDHTAISVADTTVSLGFCTDVLGMTVIGRSENRGPGQEELDDVADVSVTVTRLATAAGSPGLELLEYHTGTRRPIPGNTAGNDAAATHCVLQVASIDAITSGVPRPHTWSASEILTYGDGNRAALVRGPDGHRFLIEEMPWT